MAPLSLEPSQTEMEPLEVDEDEPRPLPPGEYDNPLVYGVKCFRDMSGDGALTYEDHFAMDGLFLAMQVARVWTEQQGNTAIVYHNVAQVELACYSHTESGVHARIMSPYGLKQFTTHVPQFFGELD